MPDFKNLAMATGLENVSLTPVSKKDNAKDCSNYYAIVLISHARMVMLKIF